MELQVQNIKNRLRDETRAIPKAKVNLIAIYDFLVVCLLILLFQKLIEAALQQQKKLETISACVPSCIPERLTHLNQDANKCFNVQREEHKQELGFESLKPEEPAGPAPKEKKGRAPPPVWYVTGDELNSVPSYMKQRLTLDKVNAAIGDMATYAEANAQLIAAPRKKELREIAMTDGVKGKHFFLETDIKGPSLKLDNTGRALLTVLRHLGRISETRIGHHRVIILLRP
ncbi:UNVERIFIED_CONTAM: Spindle and kinetochore-associated protein 1 [Sesamum calycinum]|uniref:SKA complex subunit 1 homolog n=1 Tax=Sesamum calycinum TaxID=2727403 RepID=A0AAW2SZY8_9LAMI